MSLPPEDARKLWDQYRQNRTIQERDALIANYLPLANYVAAQVHKRLTSYVDIGDIRSYALLGLIDAIGRFDPSLGFKFETYATTRIRGMIIDELRAYDWVPRSVRDRHKAIDQAREDLVGSLKREPSVQETASTLGIDTAELVSSLDQIHASQLGSLEQRVNTDPEHGSAGQARRSGWRFRSTHIDPYGSETVVEVMGVREALAAAVDACDDRARVVLTLYYYEGLTLEDIGALMGVTESRVCQIHTRAMERIRQALLLAS